MADSPRAAEPFEPEGVAWTAISPRLIIARRVVIVGPPSALAVLIVVLGVAVELPWLAAGALIPALFAGWAWWLIGRQVRAWAYAEREDDLLIRHGIMWRSIVVVPYGRMQYVDVEAGPIDRLFGIARVQLHTASAASDARIPGLPPEEAARLRDRLASRGQAKLAGL